MNETNSHAAVETGQLRRLDITNDAEAVRLLGKAITRGWLPNVYTRAGQAVTLNARTRQIMALTPATMRRLLARHTFTYKLKKAGRKVADPILEIEALPAPQLCADALSETEWESTRELQGVTATPVFVPDAEGARCVQAPGYDMPSGIHYAPRLPVETVAEKPTPEAVQAARHLVFDEVLGDFPWVAPADKANYLALLITPLIGRLTKSRSPLGAITAATAGTGKTLLAGDIPEALYGASVRPWVEGDEEFRKAVTGLLATSTSPVVLLDNVPEWTSVSSPTLAALLTSQQWSDRTLGKTDTVAYPNDKLWMTTGNSMSFGGDIPSRTCLVRLDAKCAEPAKRTGFGLGDLNAWLQDETHAIALLHSLLVLVADWVTAGMPEADHTMRQFTPWARKCGGFLTHHGLDGFLANDSQLAETDDEGASWYAFADQWHKRFGDEWKTSSEIAESAQPQGIYGTDYDPWNGHYLTDAKGNRATRKSLGRQLASKRGAFFGGDDGYRLETLYDAHAKINRFRMVKPADTLADQAQPDQAPDTLI